MRPIDQPLSLATARTAQSPFSAMPPLPRSVWRIIIEFEPLMCEHELLDSNVIARGI
jgi:hypothetical protein